MPKEKIEPDGRLVHKLRSKLGLTQEELARGSGYSKKTIENIEAGKPTTHATLSAVAEVLKVSSVESLILDDRQIDLNRDGEFLGNKSGIVIQTKQVMIEIHIDREIDSFNDDQQKKLMRGLDEFCGITGSVTIVRTRPGSVRILLRLSSDDAKRVFDAFTAGKLGQLDVLMVTPGDPASAKTSTGGSAKVPFERRSFANDQARARVAVSESTVTVWIERLRAGDYSAAGKLWDHFLQRLTRLVCDRLRTASRSVSDAEDVVLDAFGACFLALGEGRYPDVKNRDDLWKLLAVIAERKAIDQIRRNKKGVDELPTDISFTVVTGASSIQDGLQQWPTTEPPPDFAAIFAEDFRMRLESLDEDLAEVALLRLQGFTNKEIAKKIGRSVPTVERFLNLIREQWLNE